MANFAAILKRSKAERLIETALNSLIVAEKCLKTDRNNPLYQDLSLLRLQIDKLHIKLQNSRRLTIQLNSSISRLKNEIDHQLTDDPSASTTELESTIHSALRLLKKAHQK